jgi:hypothetical protein
LNSSLVTRALTVAGVAVGSALLIGALAVAMRGISPVSSDAAVTPSTQQMLAAVQGLERSPHHLVRRLASWQPPRIKPFHPAPPAAPRVVTITTPANVIQTPAAAVHTVVTPVQQPHQVRAQPANPAHEAGDDAQQSAGGGDD